MLIIVSADYLCCTIWSNCIDCKGVCSVGEIRNYGCKLIKKTVIDLDFSVRDLYFEVYYDDELQEIIHSYLNDLEYKVGNIQKDKNNLLLEGEARFFH